MFRLFSSSSGTVFEERRKKQEVWKTMRRVIDIYRASERMVSKENRQYSRHSISVPVLVQAFGSVVNSEPIIGVTKNFSDDGLAMLSLAEMPVQELAFCGIWGTQPYCFIGEIRQSRYAGGGYWETGISFKEMAYLGDWETLRPLAMCLNPDSQ
ncbi:MAG: hypothetical protein ACK6DC_12075 [Planctomycetota bacterium]|jgi:hypothetical protein